MHFVASMNRRMFAKVFRHFESIFHTNIHLELKQHDAITLIRRWKSLQFRRKFRKFLHEMQLYRNKYQYSNVSGFQWILSWIGARNLYSTSNELFHMHIHRQLMYHSITSTILFSTLEKLRISWLSISYKEKSIIIQQWVEFQDRIYPWPVPM